MSEVSKRIANLSPAKLELLAQLLKKKGGAGAAATGSVIARRPDPGAPAPLSHAQQRLWLLDQLYAGEAAFNIAAAVRLKGALDAGALARSLSEIVRRHEALRTTFHATPAGPTQIVNSSFALPLPLTDLRHYEEAERQREAARLADEEARRPFDLARGPLVRAALLRLADELHVLLLTMHHIVSDGQSMGVVVRELGALYAADCAGRPSPLADLPIQYADFAAWQQEPAQRDALRTQLDYWVRTLEDAPRVLELPADYARPRLQSFHGASATKTIPPAVGQSLHELARSEGATLYMTLLAAFSLLLHRYTGLNDIVVGAPIAGRNRPETEDLIGCFLNSLAFRIDLKGRATFRELLRGVRETTLAAYSHQDVPFEMLIESLQVERDLSRTPLFQVFFNMPNVPQEVTLAGLEVELLPMPESGSKFDLTLYVQEDESGAIRVTASYSTDLFKESRIEELLRQYQHLLTQVAARADERLVGYSLVTPEAARILPDPTAALDGGWLGSAAELFTRQAKRVPERTAVKDPRESWTYRELDERSNQLAQYLVAHGVGHEDVVAIYAHRSAPLVWATIGVLKAGAAFVMLDPSYPAARLIDCLDIAAPRAWLQLTGAGALPPMLEAYVEAAGFCCRLSLAPRGDAAAADDPLHGAPIGGVDVVVAPDDLAYIAFTSGSTGRPKGIAGRHSPLTHFLPWVAETFDLRDTDRFTMLSGLSHDPLHRDIFTPLLLGATLCIPDPDDIGAPGKLPRWMRREALSIAHLTPAMAQLLTEETPGAQLLPVESLRYTFLVGDVLTRQDVSRLRRLAPSVTCVNYFGTTETQRAVSYHVTDHGADAQQDSDGCAAKEVLPLGRGIKDVQLLVLNATGALAGCGEVGEIYMRSPHLARGYVGDEALTAERFLPNHFTRAEGDRLYRTGDLGRYLPDGQVEPMGRADHQVKVRGFRIELGEVEAALRSLAGVGACAVVAAGEGAGRRLVGYVVRTGDASAAGDEGWERGMREALRERLPDYMVPGLLVELEALPVTPNGKVNRKALAERAAGETSRETGRAGAGEAGQTELEQSLCR
ncbi:MAG TPA: amino acid adenylation domain-containing protein, partial [Pyrinomonadaceae bacterium]|nr:amino acid adenylation domain-containing protein [Pyrinomonadaceae bacterium]